MTANRSYARSDLVTSAAVANGEDLVFAYPTGTAQADFTAAGSADHRLYLEGHNSLLVEGAGAFTVVFNVGDITVTFDGATTIPANTRTVFEGALAASVTETLGGTLTGTENQTLADIGDTTSVDGSATVNKNFKEIQTQLNRLVADLQDRGVIAS